MFPKIPPNLPPSHSFKSLKSYVRAGQLSRARELFDKIPNPDLPSLTLLISAYTEQNLPTESIKLYQSLRKEKNLQPDNLLLLSIAKACAISSNLTKAREIHRDVITFGFGSNLWLGNALIDMYGKCRFIDGAKKVFDELPERDVISWTSLISAYSNCGLPKEGFWVFREMIAIGSKPNSVTVSTVLPICSELKDLNSGREIHCFVVRNKLEDNVFVSSGLIDMYYKCSSLLQARRVFDGMRRKDVVLWNVILAACFSNGVCDEALNLFDQMKVKRPVMNSASWNSMISGCTQNGRIEQAFEFFAQMQDMGLKPNNLTIASILPACTVVESLRGGKEIHAYSYKHRLANDTVIATALVLMYAKCGDLIKSRMVFDRMPRKDAVAWNSIILANSMHGCGEESLLLFRQMIDSGNKPNIVTFTGVLSGCSHSQLVNEARLVFDSMSQDYGLKPDEEHYACMADVLCRAGHLNEAYEFIQKIPMRPTASAWGALLAGCRVYKNVELGKVAASNLFEIEPDNPGNYVLLSNLLVGAKMWDDASKIRVLMRDRGITKVPGCSWVQIKNKVYTFVKGDERFSQRDEVYGFLQEMGEKMRDAGYEPDVDFVLQDVAGEEKEEVLCSHSEKLAVAFGVLNLNGGSVLRVFKNLRICGDCHNAIKFIADILRVEIIVRDNVRFHHFRDGSCSCRDLW